MIIAGATPILFGLIAVALGFDFLNGLHDAASSIATIVSTRVVSPRYAVLWAAFFNFIAFLVFGMHVANTIGTGIVAAKVIDDQVIFGALMGAISWNIITWLAGIPSSSSHALVGGLIGAGTAKAGLHGLSKALAREFGSHGITANTVVPGAIDTVRDWSQYAHQEKERIRSEIPAGRFGKTDEVAAACVFLCAETGAFVSGQAIHVNGGHYMF